MLWKWIVSVIQTSGCCPGASPGVSLCSWAGFWGGCGGVKPLCQRKWGFGCRELVLWAEPGHACLLWETAALKGSKFGASRAEMKFQAPQQGPQAARDRFPLNMWTSQVWYSPEMWCFSLKIKCKGIVSGFKQPWMAAKARLSLCSAPFLYLKRIMESEWLCWYAFSKNIFSILLWC